MIQSIEHVAIVTTDIERARAFYHEVLGFREFARHESKETGTMIHMELGGGRIELFEGGTGPARENDERARFVHLALAVDDVEAEAERLKGLGVAFEVEPRVSKISGNRLAFFRDPDGNLIELIRRAD